jgi:hypothetical protein
MESLEQARRRLDDEFGQVRRRLGKIHEALDKVEAAGPEDVLHGCWPSSSRRSRRSGTAASSAQGPTATAGRSGTAWR